jgi:hypothetical protein
MTPRPKSAPQPDRDAILAQLHGRFVCNVDEARILLDLGRVAAYRLAAEGALAEGVSVLKCGRLYKVPVRPLLLAVLGDLGDDQGEA